MPQVTKIVNLSEVKVVDRIPLNCRTLNLVKHLDEGGQVPPIHVKPNGRGQYHVLDGRHRWTAYKLLGYMVIEVRYGVSKDVENDLSISPNPV